MCIKNNRTCIFLDANAIYHYVGREKLFTNPSTNVDKKILEKKLKQYSNVFLPSSVLTEILVHFRNDLNKIQDIFYFISSKKIKIVPVGVKGYTSEELYNFASMTDVDKSLYLGKELEEKIDVETGFAYSFLFSISLAYAGYLARKNGFDENAFVNVYGTYIKTNFMDKHIGEIKSELGLGYSLNKELKYLKNKYTELLEHNVVLAHGAILNISSNGNPSVQEITQSLSNLVTLGITNTDYNVMGTIKDINQDPTFMKILLTAIPDTFKVKKYSQVQIDYLRTRYEAWLLRGQILRKNDVYDILFLDSFSDNILSNLKYNLGLPDLTLDDILLVSFDEDIKDYIKEISPNSYDLINSIPPATQ